MIWIILVGALFGAIGLCLFLTFLHEGIRHPHTLAFFHPFCEGGGGGERVLFQAIDAIMNAGKRAPLHVKKIVIYAKQTSSSIDDILENCRQRFQIKLDRKKNGIEVQLVQLKTVGLLNPKNYPRLTLLCQGMAEVVVGFEAMYKCLPEYFVDTTGCPFLLPVFSWIGGCHVACYVHYPTITSQMLRRVSDRQTMYNNSDFIAKNSFLTRGKLMYYRVIALVYYICGFAAKVVMTNGSWTNDHIKVLWPGNPKIVFPPVDIHLYEKGKKIRNKSPATILSVGQIRPEKNHKLQIQVLKLLKDSDINVRLVVAGGCRNEEDNQRLQGLKDYAKELGVAELIDWKINVTNEELRELNNTALIGIHTMIEEHFGIAVVESMAAGCIMVAHNSGGPKYDIVKELITGYLAEDAEEYAMSIKKIIQTSDQELQQMRDQAMEDLEVFSVRNFSKKFLNALEELNQS